MGDDTWHEGQDGHAPHYAERLWPAWWVWLLVPVLVSVLAIAYGAAYDPVWGWTIEVAGTASIWVLLALTTPLIRVDDRVFRAGAARLPLWAVGKATPMSRDDVRTHLRTGDARTYLLIRTWATAGAVLVEVTDPEDPHPAWLVSTRHPQTLAEALNRAPDNPWSGRPAE